MKIMTLFVLLAALAAAQERTSSAAPASKQTAAPSAAATPGIPKGAMEIEPGLFRYTDVHGKVWLARLTPFGVSTWEDKPEPAAPVVQAKEESLPKVTDLGDSVRFEKASPFGLNTWVQKKSDLTDQEKVWLARATKPSGDSKSAPQAKPAQSGGDATEKR